MRWQRLEDHLFDIDSVEDRRVYALDETIDPKDWRLTREQEEIAAPSFRDERQPSIEPCLTPRDRHGPTRAFQFVCELVEIVA
jgi:hypothetical protein